MPRASRPKQEIAWQPHPGPQTRLLTCPCDDILYGGARGGGKTDGTIGVCVAHATQHPEHARILYLRRTMPELEDVVVRSQQLLPLTGAEWGAQARTWTWPTGAYMRLRYLDRDADAMRYQGHAYTLIVVDEAGQFPAPTGIDELRATLRSAQGVPTRIVLTANPGGPGHDWLRERYVDGAEPNVPREIPGHDPRSPGQWRVYIPSRLQDNPSLMADPAYMDRIRAACEGQPWKLRAWLEGDWDASREGNLIRTEWIRAAPRYSRPPDTFRRVVQSWDCAMKGTQASDFNVCTTWGESEDRSVHLLDVWRQRASFGELERAALSLAARWEPSVIVVEDKANGSALIDRLRHSREVRASIHEVSPTTDKAARMAVQTPWLETRRVWLPRSAPWLLDYESELLGFPDVPHDDQVDSTSQALDYLGSRDEGRKRAALSSLYGVRT